MTGIRFVEPPKPPPDYKHIDLVNRDKQFQVATQTAIQAAQKAAKDAEVRRQAEAAKVAQIASQQVLQTVIVNDAKLFIYYHESGNDPMRRNSSGCIGLGQACPGSKLLAVCPALDYACEDSYFTGYMQQRYGSWQAAYEFWIRTDCRPYCGNWW